MDVPISQNSDLMLLVDQTALQKQQLSVATQQSSAGSMTTLNEAFVQLPVASQAYDSQQFILQNNCDMDMESLDELLASSLENGEMSVVEQDGRQYLLLPNVSVASVPVMGNADLPAPASQYSTTHLQGEQLLTVPSSVSTAIITGNTVYTPTTVSIPPVTNIVQVQSIPASTESVQTGTTQAPISPTDILYRFVPSLRPHSEQVKDNVQHTCPVCPFQALTEVDLDEHMEEHRNYSSSEKRGKKKKTKKKSNACRLIRTVEYTNPTRKGPFLCSVCGIQLPMLSVYKRHMKEHMKDKEFKCAVCSESFNLEINLKLHQTIHMDFSDQQDKRHKCPVCPRVFSRVASLKAHLPMHYQEETMICSECGDEFTNKCELSTHMQQHKMDLQAHIEERSEGVPYGNIDELIKAGIDCSSLIRISSKSKRLFKSPQKCLFCDKEFYKESIYKRHMLIHTGEKPFGCDYCEKTFNQASALKVHKLIHTGETPYPCPHCPRRFSQRANLRVHITRTHSTFHNFHCEQCSCTFQKLASLNSHVTRYHPIPRANSPKNSETDNFNNSDVTQKSTNNTASNEEVDVIQQLLSSLDDSDLKNTQPEELPSDIVEQALQDCGVHDAAQTQNPAISNGEVSTVQTVSLEEDQQDHTAMMTNHMEGDEDASSIPTQSNNETNADGAGQETNVQTLATVPGTKLMKGPDRWDKEITWRVRRINGVRWHQCMFCPKEFKKPSDLIRHIRTHTNERPFTCKTCNKSFAVKTTLSTHEKTHLGYKQYKCEICLKSFSTSGSLRTHHRLHTGAKPFKCPQCDKRFRTTGHRHQHFLTHLRKTARKVAQKKLTTIIVHANQPQVKPPEEEMQNPIRVDENCLPVVFEEVQNNGDNIQEDNMPATHLCVTCGKAFKRACHLEEHLRIHTGEKPYRCTHCGNSFTTASTLKAHLRKYIGYKPFKCSKCTLSFSSKFSLNRHMATHSQSRPFMCPYCRKLFKTKDTCRKHIKIHRKKLVKDKQFNLLGQNVTVGSLINPSDMFHIENIAQEETHPDVTRQYTTSADTSQQNHLSVDPNIAAPMPTVSNEIAPLTNPLPTQLDLPPDVITATLDQVNMEVVQDDLTHFDGSLGLNTVAMTTTEESHDNETADADLNNQYYQVDQLLNFKCSGCSKYFETKAHLQRHEFDLDSKKTSFPCTICHHSLECLASLTSHMTGHGQDTVHRCPICFVCFGDAFTMETHKFSHNTIPNLAVLPSEIEQAPLENLSVYPPAEEQLPISQAEKNQEDTASDPSPPKQKRKRNGFYRLSKEQNEILQQTEQTQKMSLSEKLLLDSVAETGKVSIAQAPGHRGRQKPIDGPVYKHVCQHCPKSFQKKNDLVRHIRTHTGDKPYVCEICNKGFAVKSALNSHEKVHTKMKTFRCHICNTFYSTKSSLKIHMRLHTGVTPYKCPHCPAHFISPSARKYHMAAHLEVPGTESRKPPRKSSKPNKQSSSTSISIPTVTTAAPPTVTSTATTTTVPVAPNMAETVAQPTIESKNTSQPVNINQQQLVWPDMTFTVPVETLPVMQDTEATVQVPIQMPTTNVRIDGTNITLQIHPALLQSLQDGTATLKLNTAVPSQGTHWPVQNVMLQALNPVCVQTIANPVEHQTEATNIETAVANKDCLTSGVFISPNAVQNVLQVDSGLLPSMALHQTNEVIHAPNVQSMNDNG